MKHFPGLRRFDARPIDNSKLHSFRDSILYVNFEYFKKMNSSWNNTIFSFSTYHLLDTRDRSLFSEVLDPATHTLGRFLHSRYDSSIVHIAFVCNSGLIKDKVSNNKNYKKSLEYQLSKTHDFAYIDLAAYRKSPNEKKAFYLRPTFEKFILTNWEDILDGIIFIKDCQCQNP